MNATPLLLLYLIVPISCDNDDQSKIYLLRKDCSLTKSKTQPINRVNTTSRLTAMRNRMTALKLQALFVTTHDEHQTEFVSESDKRRQYISGFSGSDGDVLITHSEAALWTDGRYHIQADEELDCSWSLMREGNPQVLTKAEWLSIQLPGGGKVGADPKLVPASTWNDLETELSKLNKNLTLVETEVNLVDEIWFNQPQEETKQAYILDDFYTGKPWTKKVQEVRNELRKLGADTMVVTALDDVAWLLNIRAFDTPYTAFLKSYVILNPTNIVLYTDPNKIKGNVTSCFEAQYPGQLKFRSYQDIWVDLPIYSKKSSIILAPSLYGYSPGVSKQIYSLIPDEKRLSRFSPIAYLRTKKNAVEALGLKEAHIRDAVALCNFFQYFEARTNSGEVWDELKVAEEVDRFRSEQLRFVSTSFGTIAAFAAHGALPHYKATNRTSSIILNNNTLLIDSGGQYYDGTTDVTRTIHLGTPTDEHREAYTRVLISSIQLASLTFPDNLNTSAIDAITRTPLWEVGYDYSHGTGHGIGSFSNVHESPVNLRYNPRKHTPPELLGPAYFLSNEPGFYLTEDFGIRLENVMEVITKSSLKPLNGHSFLGFETVTLVPYDNKLIDFGLLNVQHRRWLNRYNNQIRKLVGAELKRQNATDALEWMMKNTEHIPENVMYY